LNHDGVGDWHRSWAIAARLDVEKAAGGDHPAGGDWLVDWRVGSRRRSKA
jgi:hypothetical protein